jgi:hypothetical protein
MDLRVYLLHQAMLSAETKAKNLRLVAPIGITELGAQLRQRIEQNALHGEWCRRACRRSTGASNRGATQYLNPGLIRLDKLSVVLRSRFPGRLYAARGANRDCGFVYALV